MQRVSMTLDDDLVEAFEVFLRDKGYDNRSEAIRDVLREILEQERRSAGDDGACIGSLTYVYNHHERELARRLTAAQHAHHDLAVSTLHVHLDHNNCMETVVLKGNMGDVKQFANEVMAQAGVRHGKLYLLPVAMEEETHQHGQSHGARHQHLTPRT